VAKQRVKFTFPTGLIKEPVIWRLGREFEVVTNIRRADVTEDRGWVVLELEGEMEEIERGVQWVVEQGVRVDPVPGDIGGMSSQGLPPQDLSSTGGRESVAWIPTAPDDNKLVTQTQPPVTLHHDCGRVYASTRHPLPKEHFCPLVLPEGRECGAFESRGTGSCRPFMVQRDGSHFVNACAIIFCMT
jgi:hypothetical protein